MVVIYILAAIGIIALFSVAGFVFLLIISDIKGEGMEEKKNKVICALTDECCIFTEERGTCTGCPIAEEAENIGKR